MFQFKIKDVLIPVEKPRFSINASFQYNRKYNTYMPYKSFEYPGDITEEQMHLFWDFIENFSAADLMCSNQIMNCGSLITNIMQWAKKNISLYPILRYDTIISFIYKSYKYAYDKQFENLIKLEKIEKMSSIDIKKLINYVILQKYNYYKVIMECSQAISYVVESQMYYNESSEKFMSSLNELSKDVYVGIITPTTTGPPVNRNVGDDDSESSDGHVAPVGNAPHVGHVDDEVSEGSEDYD